MTLTLIQPDQLIGNIGPGTFLRVHSDLLGITPQWYYEYVLNDLTNTAIFAARVRPSIGNELRTFIGTEPPIGPPLGPGIGSLDFGQVCNLRVDLINAVPVVAEFANFSVRNWQPTLEVWKMQWFYDQLLNENPGFLPNDRNILLNIYENVSKFPYMATAQHPPQSGNVTIFLQFNTIAIAYSVVQFPASPPQSTGEPVYYFNLGFITPRIGSVAYKSTRISFASGFFLLPPTTTNLGLTLLGGTSIILTEYAQAPLNP